MTAQLEISRFLRHGWVVELGAVQVRIRPGKRGTKISGNLFLSNGFLPICLARKTATMPLTLLNLLQQRKKVSDNTTINNKET